MRDEWKNMEGKRVLVKIGWQRFNNDVTEAKVLEVSPSEEYVKLEKISYDGKKIIHWHNVDDIVFAEELEEVKKK